MKKSSASKSDLIRPPLLYRQSEEATNKDESINIVMTSSCKKLFDNLTDFFSEEIKQLIHSTIRLTKILSNSLTALPS